MSELEYGERNPATDGWNYDSKPEAGDARKIVSLEEDGMVWVGVRAFNHATGCWMNNNEPERAEVKAWRDLPEPARGFWQHGKFYLTEARPRMQPMEGPTLPAGDPYD